MATPAPTVTALPIPPSTSDPVNFDSRADAFLGGLPTFQTELNDLGSNVYNNATEAASSASTATTKATEAASSASTATTKASEASTSAANAATSESNAAISESNAAASESTAIAKASEATSAAATAVQARDDALAYASSQLNATSTTSNSLSIGIKTFTVEANKAFVPNQYMVIYRQTEPSKFMQGTVTAYNKTTGELNLTVDFISESSGPYTDWGFGIIGKSGSNGVRNTVILTADATAVEGTDYVFNAICKLTAPAAPSPGGIFSFCNATGLPGPKVDFLTLKVKGIAVGEVTLDGAKDAATVKYTQDAAIGYMEI